LDAPTVIIALLLLTNAYFVVTLRHILAFTLFSNDYRDEYMLTEKPGHQYMAYTRVYPNYTPGSCLLGLQGQIDHFHTGTLTMADKMHHGKHQSIVLLFILY